MMVRFIWIHCYKTSYLTPVRPLFGYFINERYPVFDGISMIDTFLKHIYHTYSLDN